MGLLTMNSTKNRKMTTNVIRIIAAVSLALTSMQSHSAIVLTHDFSIALGTEYQDNLQLVQKKDSVWLYTAVPSYTLSALDGKNQWYAGGTLRIERSSNRSVSDNREDPFAKIGWKRDLERGSAGLEATYSKSSTRSRQFLETGLVQEDSTDRTRTITANWSRLITEQLNAALAAGYSKTDFGRTGGGASTTFTDNSTRYLNADLSYKLSESLSPYAKIGLNDYRASDRINYQNYLGGVMVTVSPKFDYDLSAGVTHFSSSGKNKWIGAVKTNYLGERYKIGGALSRAVYPTDIGGVELSDQLTLNYNYELSEKSRWGAGLLLAENKSLNSNKAQEYSAFYARDLTAAWVMNIYGQKRYLKEESQSTVDGNTIGITFTYNMPKL